MKRTQKNQQTLSLKSALSIVVVIAAVCASSSSFAAGEIAMATVRKVRSPAPQAPQGMITETRAEFNAAEARRAAKLAALTQKDPGMTAADVEFNARRLRLLQMSWNLYLVRQEGRAKEQAYKVWRAGKLGELEDAVGASSEAKNEAVFSAFAKGEKPTVAKIPTSDLFDGDIEKIAERDPVLRKKLTANKIARDISNLVRPGLDPEKATQASFPVNEVTARLTASAMALKTLLEAEVAESGSEGAAARNGLAYLTGSYLKNINDRRYFLDQAALARPNAKGNMPAVRKDDFGKALQVSQ